MRTWIAVVMLSLLASCGGGGKSSAPPPTILGMVLSFPAGAAPTGLPNAMVGVLDPSTGAAITNATVTVNGVALAYNFTPARSEYEGTVTIEPGTPVNIVVSVDGRTYAATGTQPTSYPALTTPVSGDIWGANSTNTVSWSGGVSLNNAGYLLGIFDAADFAAGTPLFVPLSITTNSYSIPSGSLTTGNKNVIVGITTATRVLSASPDSGIVIGGFNYVPVTVSSGVTTVPPPPSTLTSVAVVPANPTLVNGTTAQLKVIGTYSDNSTRDLTSQTTWSSSDQTKATVDASGLISAGVANGSTTITASAGGVSGVTTAYVFQPTSVATDWATFQGNAAHTGFVDVQLDPAVFTQLWTWTAPPNTGGNAVHINSVATSAGKVFVTRDIYFDQAALYALNEADGTTNWVYTFGQMADAGPPAVANGSVLVPTNDSLSNCAVWAIDAALGTYQFKMPSTCQWSSFFAPTAIDGSVLQTSQTGVTNSFSIVSGGLQWSANPLAADQTTPAADANYVYQYGRSINGAPALRVFDRLSGTEVASITDPFSSSITNYWMFSAPMLGSTGNAIVYSDGGFSGLGWSSSEQYGSRILVNYDVTGKTYTWRSTNTYLTHPAIANGVVYAARNAPAALDALSEIDGHVLWSWTPPAGDTGFHRNTVVTRNLVFVSTDKNVYAIDLTTHQAVWQFAQPGMLAISGGNVLYIVTGATLSDGNLVAIRLK